MNVYFFDNDSANITTINEFIKKWDINGYNFFVNMKFSDFFKKISNISNDIEFVVFIDTRVKTKTKNSLEIAKLIRETNESCHIIFTSGHPKDMAFCLKNLIRPSGFLTKPVSPVEYYNQLFEIHTNKQRSLNQREQKIIITSGGVKYYLLFDEILYFTTLEKKILCKTIDGEIEFYGTLSYIEKEYANHFLRCHSGFLVNKLYIKECTRNTLKLCNCEDILPISKKYHSIIKEYISKLCI